MINQLLPAALRSEIVRKCIHLIICIAILLLPSKTWGTLVIGGGIVIYTLFELLRIWGKPLPIINSLIRLAARSTKPIPIGPYTLAVGVLATIYLFPHTIAVLAIFSLAFGDGIASLVGMSNGRHRLPFGYKTWEGSLACFVAIFFPLLIYTRSPLISLFSALTGTICEAIPIQDADNILIPLGTGAMLWLLS